MSVGLQRQIGSGIMVPLLELIGDGTGGSGCVGYRDRYKFSKRKVANNFNILAGSRAHSSILTKKHPNYLNLPPPLLHRLPPPRPQTS